MTPSVNDEYTVRAAVVERHASDDSITVSPPRN
jgi:hypothetical protein